MVYNNRSSIMSTTKTLLLAGFAAVSLGVGQAMAQDGGGAVSDYWAGVYRAQAAQAAANANKGVTTVQPAAPQFGASDIERTAPVHVDSDMTDGGL
jgi:hypothetical protein